MQQGIAFTHFFLGTFTEGWAVLALLGIIRERYENASPVLPIRTGWLWKPILFGSMLIFPFSLAESLVTPLLYYTAKAGTLLIVLSLSLAGISGYWPPQWLPHQPYRWVMAIAFLPLIPATWILLESFRKPHGTKS